MSLEVAGYRVQNRLYRGRHSSVYRAVRSSDGVHVALKLPTDEYPTQHENDRLRAEYDLLSGLGHDRVVRALELIEQEGRVVLVLEDSGRPTLASLLEDGPLSIATFLDLAIALADALAAVHAARIIHKDIEPANILADPARGDVVLLDFDIATRLPRESQVIATPARLEGTLEYMSPEQTGRMNRSIDYRTDLYSFGATCYAMLAGRPPFEATEPLQLIHRHIAAPPEPLDRVRPAVSPVLARLVDRLLAKTAEDRYASVNGVRADLEHCRSLLDADGGIVDFELGRRDVSSRFHIPEKLYGRAEETDRLLRSYDAVGEGAASLMLVSGHPGVGKSRLVNEIQKPVVARRGYFVAGKFDQYKRDIPFASLHEALRSLIRQVLTESDADIDRVRQSLVDAFGPNGRLITDAIPEVELIVGPQPDAPELPPRESQNRFQRVFLDFVSVFCRPEHPLCILLDDVQWIDSATVAWLEETLATGALGSLLVVCAYRDNEVTPSHPFSLAVDRIRQAGAAVDGIRLEPLAESTLNELVADTLVTTPKEASPLTRLVHEKTRGNPFFVNRLLESLHQDEALRFDPDSRSWRYDLDRVRRAAVTDNVVDFMTARLQRLDADVREVLTLAACVGSGFDLDTLQVVTELDPPTLRDRLRIPLEQGLVVRTPGETSGEEHYRFEHDRIQQAAYSLMSDEEAKRVRLRVGRSMLGRLPAPGSDDRLFDVLQHLNVARSLVTEPERVEELARLNTAAAVRARTGTAYGPALEHARIAMELLEDETLDATGELRFEATLERAECEHLNGDDEAAERFYDLALDLARDDFEKGRVYERRIHFHTNLAQFQAAYDTGLEAAALFGIQLPRRFTPPLFLVDYVKSRWRRRGRNPVELLDLPEMTDERRRTAVRFMAAVAKAAYQIRPELCVAICTKIVNESLAHGNTPDSVIGYLAHGVIFEGAVRANHQAGYDFGSLVLSLAEKYENGKQKAEVNFVYGYFANSWSRPMADTERYYRVAYRTGIDSGDFFHASCACSGIVQSMFMRGVPLDDVEAETGRYLDFLERVDSEENIGTLRAMRQTIRNLRGETHGPTTLSDGDFDEDAFSREAHDYGSLHFAHMFFVDRLQMLVLRGEYAAAMEAASASAAFLQHSPGMQHAADHHFYHALAAAALAQRRWRPGALFALWRIRRRMRRWAERTPENYLARARLLDAEWARATRRPRAAERLYDDAIDAAARHGLLHLQGHAAHRAGLLHLEGGRRRSARHYLVEAIRGYHRWGARDLAAGLAEEHAEVIGHLPPDSQTAATDGERLDLGTLLKSSQALSGEVQLGALLSKLMAVVLENAGADRGVLLIPEDGELRVQAEAALGEETVVRQDVPLEGFDEVATTVVKYVARAGESVVLDDAAEVGDFGRDPYIQRRNPRSVLCAPLLNQGQLRGVLYLENRLTRGAFTDERIELLKLLSGQIAISIDNAVLYERLEDKVRQRTEQLEARNRFIRRTFGRYLSDDIVDSLLETPDGTQLGGEKRTVTILMSDLRGFTSIAEHHAPEQVVSVINNYLGVMTEIIMKYQGTIDEFIGDAILAIFGAPLSHEDDAARAVACAVEMQLAMRRVNEINRAAGLPDVSMGIGLHTGEVVVGSIGSEKRAKYGVVGSTVNMSGRIEGYTVQDQILVSESTRLAVGEDLDVGGRMEVAAKGAREPLALYEVHGIGGEFDLVLPRRDMELFPLEREMPVRFALVRDKRRADEWRSGTMVRLSERRAEIRGRPFPALTDLELGLLDDDGQSRPERLYAKVLAQTGEDDGFTVHFTSVPEVARQALRSRIPAIAESR